MADMSEIPDPNDCNSMTEVRAGVDDVDRRVVDALGDQPLVDPLLEQPVVARCRGGRQRDDVHGHAASP